jgi:hypothetical protein
MKRKIALAIALFFVVLLVSAQKVEQTLAAYADKFQSDRVYLHYDKSVYTPGETIWFKAYLMADIYPADESKTLYTDFIDDNGAVLSHVVSPVVDGISTGQLEIPSDITSKYVHVRSYTKWMLNFDTAFIYKKDIRLLQKETGKPAPKPALQYSLNFFPEGGDAIAGILNKIAFKATDQWGNPVKVKGTLLENEKPVQEFASVHNGMGFIMLNPVANALYKAKWKDEKGAEHTTELPSIKTSGVGFQLNVANGKYSFTINRSADVSPALQNLYVLGTMHGHTVFKANPSLVNKTSVQGVIPTKELPSGILTVTIFDANWNAIAERVTFINNNEYSFQPTVTVQHWGLNKRARNEIVIKVPDSLQANLSVAITDASITADSSNNILSHLLLNSELKGLIYNPSYYFKNNSDSITHQLDLVMLTNGWRRFKWEDVAAGKMPAIKYARDSNYLFLSGKVLGVVPAALNASDNIIMLLKEKDSTRMLIMPIERDATFGDPNIVLMDSLRIYYQLKSKMATKADIQFMTSRLPSPNYTGLKNSFQFYNPIIDTAGNYRHKLLADEQARALAMLQGKTLQNVTVRSKTKSPLEQMDERYARGLFSGGDAVQFDIVNDPTALGRQDIFSYLQGKVAGLMITQSGMDVNLQWRGGTPQLYLDEMAVDAQLISSIPVTDIAYVKVFRPPFVGGMGGGSGGAIAIYTRKGGDIAVEPGKGLAKNVVMGYTPIRQFYSPNYSTYDKRNEQPDMRTTLHWAPVVTTNPKKSSATIVFYNNDVTKAFRIIIEGMTKEGLLTHYEEVLE